MAPNKRMQENKPTLKFNFTLEYMWPVLILGIFCSDGPIQRAPVVILMFLKSLLGLTFKNLDFMVHCLQNIITLNYQSGQLTFEVFCDSNKLFYVIYRNQHKAVIKWKWTFLLFQMHSLLGVLLGKTCNGNWK